MHNRLLDRQIRKHLSDTGEVPENLRDLLDAISESYDHFENDKRMIERSMDLSSTELLEANDSLQHETERQGLVLEKLREILEVCGLEQYLDDVPASTHGDVLALAGVLRKLLDEQQEATRELRKSEERFRMLAEYASDLVVRYNADGFCTYMSPSSRLLLNYEPEELIGKTVFDVMHPEDRRATAAALRRAMHQAIPFALTARVRRSDGEYRWLETTIRVIRDSDSGEVIEFHTTARDVSLRIDAQEQLKRTSTRLRTLVESLEGGVIVVDDQGRIAVINKTFCRMYDVDATPDEIIGGDSAAVTAAAMRLLVDPEAIVAWAREMMDRMESVTGAELGMIDGRTIESDYVPIMLGSTYGGHLWHCRDITRRKQAEAEVRALNEELRRTNELLRVERDREKEHVRALKELNAMKNEFVSSVSHELRTPLASIIGFAQTLLIDPDLGAEMRQEFVQIIHTEGKRLAKLIDDLLDTARIESGRATVERREADLVPLCDRVVQSIAQQATTGGVTVTTSYDTPSITGTFDPDRIGQVILNLLGNAVKFTPRGGHVELTAGATDDEIVFSVRDTGMGIPEHDLPHVFEKFYRVARPGMEIRGTGLGLAIVHQLIDLHHGKISVDSEIGAGSIFTVRFPRC